MSKIPREAWRIIEIKVSRYPESKLEYQNIVDEILHNRAEEPGPGGSGAEGSPTEKMAIKIADHPRLKRLETEINAVESVYNAMIPDHQKVIQARFWSYRYTKMSYFDMERCTSYRERQMRRIVANFIREVGKKLGEL